MKTIIIKPKENPISTNPGIESIKKYWSNKGSFNMGLYLEICRIKNNS